MADPDILMIKKLKNGDVEAFEYIFKNYFPGLCIYAKKYVPDTGIAEELVQDIFLKLWESRSTIEFHTSLKSYLFRSVHNSALNFLKHLRVEDKHKAYLKTFLDDNAQYDPAENPEPDLMQKINEAIDQLPEKCRRIFRMSRIDGLKHKEIAEQLEISEKTVEAQIRNASIILRDKLKDYWVIIITLCSGIMNN